MATAARKSPTAAEALKAPVEFEFAGETFSVAPTSEWPYEALEAFEDGKLSAFIRSVLGTEQHEAFKATKPTVSLLGDFIAAMQKALGIAGE